MNLDKPPIDSTRNYVKDGNTEDENTDEILQDTEDEWDLADSKDEDAGYNPHLLAYAQLHAFCANSARETRAEQRKGSKKRGDGATGETPEDSNERFATRECISRIKTVLNVRASDCQQFKESCEDEAGDTAAPVDTRLVEEYAKNSENLRNTVPVKDLLLAAKEARNRWS